MSGFKISFDSPTERVAGLLDGVAERATSDAVTSFELSATNWRIDVYFDHEPDAAAFAAVLKDCGFSPATPFVIEKIADENWVAKVQSRLAPVVAGRFIIHGSHDASAPQVKARGNRALLIDAGEAFGTAHHATTRGCLVALDGLLKRGGIDRVLDIGTGAGTLALAAAAMLPAATVQASDIDPVAVEVARANARRNRFAGRVHFIVAAGLRHALLNKVRADLVFANILAGPLIRLAGDISGRVADGGALVLSGLLASQAREVSAAYHARGLFAKRRLDLDGWTTLVLRRATRRPVKKETATRRGR